MSASSGRSVWTAEEEGIPDARKIFQNASAYLKAEQYDEAKEEFTKLVRFHPGFAPAYHSLGVIALRQNKTDEAVSYLRRATDLAPAEANSHYFLAIALNQKGEFDNAIKEYQRTIELAPDMMQPRHEVGLLHYRMANYVEAEEALRSTLTKAPDSTTTHLLLGMTYVKLDKPEQAIEEILELRRLKDEAKANTLEALMRSLKPEAPPAAPPSAELFQPSIPSKRPAPGKKNFGPSPQQRVSMQGRASVSMHVKPPSSEEEKAS